jgi:putative SOS response-associated peptidase YedK
MVERYSVGVSAQQLADFFGVDPYGFEQPRYNAAPAHLLPVITTGSAGLSHFYWGTMPQWAKNKSISEKIINVRGEQIPERPTLKKSLAKLRCLVPADGFYAWKKIGKKTNIPYRLRLPDHSLFGMAAFWEEFEDEAGEQFHTFSIITTPANESVALIADRMPVMLGKAEGKKWLDANSDEAALLALLTPHPAWKMEHYTVSPRINNPEVDDVNLTKPAPPADQFGNLTLFS